MPTALRVLTKDNASYTWIPTSRYANCNGACDLFTVKFYLSQWLFGQVDTINPLGRGKCRKMIQIQIQMYSKKVHTYMTFHFFTSAFKGTK